MAILSSHTQLTNVQQLDYKNWSAIISNLLTSKDFFLSVILDLKSLLGENDKKKYSKGMQMKW